MVDGSSRQAAQRKRIEQAFAPAVAQRALDGAYDFTGWAVEESGKAWVKFLQEADAGRRLVIKSAAEAAPSEATNSRIARLGGLVAPDMRRLTPDELATVPANLKGDAWWLMEFLPGDTLTEKTTTDDWEAVDDFDLTDEQWQDIGASAAYQLFVLGYDRWRLSIPEEQVDSRTSPDNTILTPDGRAAMFDTPVSHMNRAAAKGADTEEGSDYAGSVEAYARMVVGVARGGPLHADIVNQLPKPVNRPKDAGQLLQAGFIGFMENMAGDGGDQIGELHESDDRGAVFEELRQVFQNIMGDIRSGALKVGGEGGDDADSDSGDDDSGGPPARGKKKCFVTSACVAARGLPDDCELLTELRNFRDGYLSSRPDGPALIAEYYRVAPGIVESVEGDPDSAAIFDGVFQELETAVGQIRAGRLDEALATYVGLVGRLSVTSAPAPSVPPALSSGGARSPASVASA